MNMNIRKIGFATFVILVIIIIGVSFAQLRDRSSFGDGGSDPTSQAASSSDTSRAQETPQSDKTMQKPEMKIDVTKSYLAEIETDKGVVTVALAADKTPTTVNNFVHLAQEGFYDGTVFHRILKDFMIQGGDPEGTGAGGPGYRFDDEPFEGEYERGIIAMANAGPNTNGSQFFIMHGNTPLQKNYVIFGRVVDGMEVVDTIAESEVEVGASGEPSSPVDPTVVKSVKIIEE